MFWVVWLEAVGIHHLKYQNLLSDWFTAGFATHANAQWHFQTQPHRCSSVCFFFLHCLLSPSSLPAFPFLFHFPSFPHSLHWLSFTSPHFLHHLFLFHNIFWAPLFPFSQFLSLSHVFYFSLPSIFIFCFSLLTFSLSLSSFDGLVVGGTDSARLKLLSQCEMYCCGDDMSHFTLDWWCVWEGEWENYNVV